MERRILTHGTVVGKLVFGRYINLTGTKKLDKKHGRYGMYSFNPSKNNIQFAKQFCMTNKCNFSRMIAKEPSLYPTEYDKKNPLLVSAIKVWVWDERFEELKKNKLLTSRKYSTSFCEKNNLDFIDYKDKKLWGIVDLDNHFEVIIKNEKLTPKCDCIILGKDILNYCSNSSQIRALANIDDDIKIIVDKTLLISCDAHRKKYESNKPNGSDIRLTNLVFNCIDNEISFLVVKGYWWQRMFILPVWITIKTFVAKEDAIRCYKDIKKYNRYKKTKRTIEDKEIIIEEL